MANISRSIIVNKTYRARRRCQLDVVTHADRRHHHLHFENTPMVLASTLKRMTFSGGGAGDNSSNVTLRRTGAASVRDQDSITADAGHGRK